jgi:hypothetical protein
LRAFRARANFATQFLEGWPIVSDDTSAGGGERLNNRIALTIALLATFLALSAIKSGNIEEAAAQAQAERNNSWAWYQAVRVREDMASYELTNLQRMARAQDPLSSSDIEPAPLTTASGLAAEVREQEAELGRVRARKTEVEQRAQAAEADFARLSVIADQYDFSDALIAIAMSLLAVCALAKVRWLYWFSLLPALTGLAWGVAAMLKFVIPAQALTAWLN